MRPSLKKGGRKEKREGGKHSTWLALKKTLEWLPSSERIKAQYPSAFKTFVPWFVVKEPSPTNLLSSDAPISLFQYAKSLCPPLVKSFPAFKFKFKHWLQTQASPAPPGCSCALCPCHWIFPFRFSGHYVFISVAINVQLLNWDYCYLETHPPNHNVRNGRGSQ